ncbi:hypothetical protein EG68_12036, partial [Paragonimus skrjabini miyazakii]
ITNEFAKILVDCLAHGLPSFDQPVFKLFLEDCFMMGKLLQSRPRTVTCVNAPLLALTPIRRMSCYLQFKRNSPPTLHCCNQIHLINNMQTCCLMSEGQLALILVGSRQGDVTSTQGCHFFCSAYVRYPRELRN